jgi:hypothetical protein
LRGSEHPPPLSPPRVRGKVVLLKGRVEKLRLPLEAEMPTKAMMAGDAEGEMPPEMRVMPMEPVVKSMAAAEGEGRFTTRQGWRRSQHHHQQGNGQQPAMSRHDPSPLPTFVPSLRCDARVAPHPPHQAMLDAALHPLCGRRALSHRALPRQATWLAARAMAAKARASEPSRSAGSISGCANTSPMPSLTQRTRPDATSASLP